MRRMALAVSLLFVAATSLACGGSSGSKRATNALQENAPPKCESYPPKPMPPGIWEARDRALRAIGKSVNTVEVDEPLVFDALAREVRSIAEAGSCMPAFNAKTDGTVEYDLNCPNPSPALKPRVDRIEAAIRSDGRAFLDSAKQLAGCRSALAMAQYRLTSAAKGTLAEGKLDALKVGCSYLNQEPCAKACEQGASEACSTAALFEKDQERKQALFGRGCDLALGNAKASVEVVLQRCAGVSSHSQRPEDVERFSRLSDRVCTAKPSAPQCWGLFDRKSPKYDPQRAKSLAAHIDCRKEVVCPTALLLDKDAPHYDAARAEALTSFIGEVCQKRDAKCFMFGGAVPWALFDASVRGVVAKANTEECDGKGIHGVGACYKLAIELGRSGAMPDIERARAVAARLCEDNPIYCPLAADCTAKGECASAPDPALARTYWVRACDAFMKLDPSKPREHWPACKSADATPQ